MKSLSCHLHYIFRIACAMCFIGHGAFGIITKPIWCNYFGVFGIGELLAYKLMPLVGTADIVMGLLLIIYPVPAVAVWLVFWGFFTATLRPLSGEPFAEFLERAGNYGAPLVLLILSRSLVLKPRYWFEKMKPTLSIDESQINAVVVCLRIIACTLLLGHGWLNLIEKSGLIKQYMTIGIGEPILTAQIIGYLEVAGAMLILFSPVRQIVFIFFLWKMISELFYPSYELFEWIERGGSYAILLGLWLLLKYKSNSRYSAPTRLNTKEMNDSQGAITNFVIMKKMLTVFSFAGILICVCCNGNKNALTPESVNHLLAENKAYPKAVEYRIFCNATETAKKISESNLVKQGLVTVQLQHTVEDVGRPLVHFTEKAIRYFLPTSDTLRSIDVQIVKIADEYFSDVSNIVLSLNGKQASVEYKVKIKNITPFADLLNSEISKEQVRKTTFTLTNNGWRWDKKIIAPAGLEQN